MSTLDFMPMLPRILGTPTASPENSTPFSEETMSPLMIHRATSPLFASFSECDEHSFPSSQISARSLSQLPVSILDREALLQISGNARETNVLYLVEAKHTTMYMINVQQQGIFKGTFVAVGGNQTMHGGSKKVYPAARVDIDDEHLYALACAKWDALAKEVSTLEKQIPGTLELVTATPYHGSAKSLTEKTVVQASVSTDFKQEDDSFSTDPNASGAIVHTKDMDSSCCASEGCLITPYCEGKALFNYAGTNEDFLFPLLQQSALCIAQFHAHGYSHNDVKPHNLLLRHHQVYLVDFECAKPISDRSWPERISADYVPPEIPNKPRYPQLETMSAESMSRARDIWSWGATAYHLLTGEVLISSEGKEDRANYVLNQLRTIQQREVDAKIEAARISDKAKALLKMVLKIDPLERPESMEVILQHPLFN